MATCEASRAGNRRGGDERRGAGRARQLRGREGAGGWGGDHGPDAGQGHALAPRGAPGRGRGAGGSVHGTDGGDQDPGQGGDPDRGGPGGVGKLTSLSPEGRGAFPRNAPLSVWSAGRQPDRTG